MDSSPLYTDHVLTAPHSTEYTPSAASMILSTQPDTYSITACIRDVSMPTICSANQSHEFDTPLDSYPHVHVSHNTDTRHQQLSAATPSSAALDGFYHQLSPSEVLRFISTSQPTSFFCVDVNDAAAQSTETETASDCCTTSCTCCCVCREFIAVSAQSAVSVFSTAAAAHLEEGSTSSAADNSRTYAHTLCQLLGPQWNTAAVHVSADSVAPPGDVLCEQCVALLDRCVCLSAQAREICSQLSAVRNTIRMRSGLPVDSGGPHGPPSEEAPDHTEEEEVVGTGSEVDTKLLVIPVDLTPRKLDISATFPADQNKQMSQLSQSFHDHNESSVNSSAYVMGMRARISPHCDSGCDNLTHPPSPKLSAPPAGSLAVTADTNVDSTHTLTVRLPDEMCDGVFAYVANTCEVCGELCTSALCMRLHRVSHGQPPLAQQPEVEAMVADTRLRPVYRCQWCACDCDNYEALTNHVRATHADSAHFVCPLCAHECHTHDQLLQHVCTAHAHLVDPGSAQPVSLTDSGAHTQTIGGKMTSSQSAEADDQSEQLCTNPSSTALLDHCFDVTPTEGASVAGKSRACRFCQRRFQSSQRLASHERIHTGERPFVCADCPHKSFHSKASRDTHVRTFHRANPHVCTVCGRKCESGSAHARHMRSHSGTAPQHTCQKCGRHFTTRHSLEAHDRSVHRGHAPFACGVCLRRFAYKASWRLHMDTHATTEVAKTQCARCQVCARTFTSRSSLRTHMHSHTGRRPYVCEWCDKDYSRKDLLALHRLHVHGVTPDKQYSRISRVQRRRVAGAVCVAAEDKQFVRLTGQQQQEDI